MRRARMTDTLTRINEIQRQAEAEIAGAADTAALEEVRVRHLGRKAELPNLLRTVAELPPEERSAVGKARQPGPPGARARAAEHAAEALAAARARGAAGARPRRRHPARATRPRCPGACT